MIQVNRIYLIFNRLVTKKFLVDTSDKKQKKICIHLTLTTVMSTMLTKSILTGVYFLGIAHSK